MVYFLLVACREMLASYTSSTLFSTLTSGRILSLSIPGKYEPFIIIFEFLVTSFPFDVISVKFPGPISYRAIPYFSVVSFF